MSDTRRTVLIASGISLLVVVLVPLLLCLVMMTGMGSMDMGSTDMSGMRGTAWRTGGTLLLILVLGAVLLRLGVKQR
jgi:hypothetical protein